MALENDGKGIELLIKAREYEEKFGKTVEDVLLDIIYQKEDLGAAVEAIRIYYEIVLNPDLDLDEIDKEPELAEVISFKERDDFENEE